MRITWANNPSHRRNKRGPT